MTRAPAVALLALLAAPVCAQDDWRWDPAATREPAIGERTFDEFEDVQSRTTRIEMPGQPVSERAETVTLSVRYVSEVVAVTSGSPRVRVTVEKWQRKVGESVDASLEGTVLVVDGPAERRRAVLETAKALSPAAREWVERDLAKPLRAGRDPLDPPAPVTSSSEWSLDPTRLAKELFPGFDVDPAGSSATGRLRDVRVVEGRRVGDLDWKVALKLRTFPGSQGVPFAEGGVFRVSCEGESCLEPGLRAHGTMRMKIDLSGTAERALPDGEKVRVSIDLHFDKRSRRAFLP